MPNHIIARDSRYGLVNLTQSGIHLVFEQSLCFQ